MFGPSTQAVRFQLAVRLLPHGAKEESESEAAWNGWVHHCGRTRPDERWVYICADGPQCGVRQSSEQERNTVRSSSSREYGHTGNTVQATQ